MFFGRFMHIVFVCLLIVLFKSYVDSFDIGTYVYYKHNNCISKILSDDVFSTEKNIRLSVCKNKIIDVRYFLKHTPTIIGLNMNHDVFNRLVQESQWVNDSITGME
jgi:hypothetical protein